ncbi:MAG: HAMP domain-containing protein [Micromonosporaceae bacterium]
MGLDVLRPANDVPTSTSAAPGSGERLLREEDLQPLRTALLGLRDGNFRTRLELPPDGILADIGSIFNQVLDRNEHVAAELTRVRREVARQGRLDVRLSAGPGQGSWASTIDAANSLIEALVIPAAKTARVLDAVAEGDLSRRVDLDDGSHPLRGDLRRSGNAVNRMVEQLALFTGEVNRVAREVGTEGRLGGRARVRGMRGRWRDAIDAVNAMSARLTAQVRDIAVVTTAVAEGDLTRKVTVEASGELLELKLTVNTMVDQLSAFADEVTRVAREVGTEGRLGGQAQARGVSGVWKDLTDNVNFMASNLTTQVRNIAQVATAVAQGDLSRKITVEVKGEILELTNTINTMVDQLSAFADEVTRVAREVGTEGRLGGRAEVRGVSGMWKDLTNNVNFMANNLTVQVRNIAQVSTAVANGDLSKKITVDAQGEILQLKDTINTMVDQLSAFADEVTRVAREVGTEGRLGGQAEVEGVSGTWKRLTESVNLLASNLTTQVRAIAEVASSVARGDLSRSISVEAQGEVAELKDNVNLMVANLRETTRAKDWLESNLSRIAGLMQGHRDLVEVADLILRELTPLVSAQYGAFFLAERGTDGTPVLAFIAGYGYGDRQLVAERIPLGRGLVGQAAVEQRRILINEAPKDFIKINSGLGEAAPASVVILPVLFEDQLLGVIELASFSRFSDVHLAFFDQFVGTIGVAINTIIANARTESLLSESQRLAQQLQERSDELQRQQAELRRSNAELEEKAALLSTSSQYKSEFLANMSHELRTPLNSLLVLARLLADNPDGNLSAREVEFATTIYGAGSDLLQLINDILDLSKIEAGRMDVLPKTLPLAKLTDYVDATFRPLAAERGLAFHIAVGNHVPKQLYTDEQRLQQILRNLLSNALKFTSSGEVRLSIDRGNGPMVERLGRQGAGEIIAFSVTDTGIGIPPDKLRVIFEAFQQADGTTNRKYGGTGLGLSISREIAHLLGGKIHAASDPGKGSAFTLYLPVLYRAESAPADGAVITDGEVEAEVADRIASSAHDDDPAAFARPAAPAFGLDDTTDHWPSAARLQQLQTGQAARVLTGKKVLIVDDDIRNVFALTHVLGRVGMEVFCAEDGREGIEWLEENPDVALVLMDLMMPEMDGYETIKAIRRKPRLAELPIIAITAKAMRGDREKTIECGASEYVPKPVDIDHLLDVMCEVLGDPGSGD